MARKNVLLHCLWNTKDNKSRRAGVAQLLKLQARLAATEKAARAAEAAAHAAEAARADLLQEQLTASRMEIGKLKAEWALRPLIEYGVIKVFKKTPWLKPASMTAQVKAVLRKHVFKPKSWEFQTWCDSFLSDLPGKKPLQKSSRFAEFVYDIYAHLSDSHHKLPQSDDGDDDEAGFHIWHPQFRMRCAMALTVAALQRAHALDDDMPIFFHTKRNKRLLKQGKVQKLTEDFNSA